MTIIGIRHAESVRRSKRNAVEVSDRSFSGDLEEFFEWQEKAIAEKEEKLIKKMQKEGKKVNEDFFTANKEHEVRCISGKDSILVSPIIEWSDSDVWSFLNNVVRVPHCELYDNGYHRIGCILCPMSTPRSKRLDVVKFPHAKHRWIQAIKSIIKEKHTASDTLFGVWHKPEIKRVTGELTEDEIAEHIFAWWISGLPLKKWFAKTFLQRKIEFEQ